RRRRTSGRVMKIGLISDTHNQLRPEVFEIFEDVELILHAGDVGAMDIIAELETLAPVHAVMGNTDSSALQSRVRDEIRLELEGHRVVVVHGHLLGSPNADRLHAAYADADVIVYGHTHRQRTDLRDGCLIVNPGAAGAARFDLKPCVAILTLEPGRPPHVQHVPIATS
ncbi:MAG: metallophosphoesterase family protein, partial [Gemmatimonadetes bacterium]|nr:metallophosphoesterase family protein [Gemmatimonadota bacterium]